MAETRIGVQEEGLDQGQVYEWLSASEGGAVLLFAGTTRKVTGDRVTQLLTYEAHESMAESEMRRLAEEAMSRWELMRVVLLHRTGVVPVSEASVLVGVASAHRDEAYAANRFLIDELKKRVPIWKRETFEDGSTEWQGDSWAD